MQCPTILIDGGMVYLHTQEEFSSLCREVLLGDRVYKRFCGSGHYVFVYPLRGLRDAELWGSLGRAGVEILELPLQQVLYLYSSSRPVYLDPYAQEDLSPRDLYYHDTFIIGGIVDKPPRKRLTTRLAELTAPDVVRKRISLRGSIVGVPPEINSITEIILRGLVHGDLERAVRETQSRRDAMLRAYYELVKRRREMRSREDVEKAYRELSTWLNLDTIVFRRALRRAGIPRDIWI